MKNRQARRREFTITLPTRDARGKPTTVQVIVIARRWRSAVRVARGVLRGDTLANGRPIPIHERERRSRA